MTDFLTIATSKLGLNLVGPYDRFRWRQQIEGYPYHKNTKVKETTNMVDLVQRDILPGEGMEAPIQLSVLVLDRCCTSPMSFTAVRSFSTRTTLLGETKPMGNSGIFLDIWLLRLPPARYRVFQPT